jgi:NADH:ubiquinone oxidoreductase subunit E
MPALLAIAGQLDETLDLIGAEDSPLTPEIVQELADDLDTTPVRVYAAAALFSQLAFDTSENVQFEVCMGECQRWGAADVMTHLLGQYEERKDADGEPAFSIVARRCLDLCEQAAMVRVHTPDGVATLVKAGAADIDAALAQVLDPTD